LKTTRNSFLLAVPALAVALCAVAWANGGSLSISKSSTVAEGYLGTQGAVYRTGLSGADNVAVDHSTITDLDLVYCGGYQVVSVHGRHSTSAGTVVAHAIRYTSDGTIMGVESFTLTADDSSTLGSLYFSNSVPLDTEGCSSMRIQIEAPSAGTVDLWTASY